MPYKSLSAAPARTPVRLKTTQPAGLEYLHMSVARRDPRIAALGALGLILLTLAACGAQPDTSSGPGTPLGTPAGTSYPAALAALTRQNMNSGDQAVATAEVMRANAQATLNSADATLSAAQTQVQDNANVAAAQVAAAAEIVRANAQATLGSAGATQSAALTQDAIGQTQVAAATSQGYADQARQREEQRRGPMAFLWTWCLPAFVVLFAGLCLWGFWRWLRIQQNDQLIAGQPIENGPDKLLASGSDAFNGRYRLTKPDEEMRGWLDEIKRKLLSREEENDDNPNS
jgi:hypothetical protein